MFSCFAEIRLSIRVPAGDRAGLIGRLCWSWMTAGAAPEEVRALAPVWSSGCYAAPHRLLRFDQSLLGRCRDQYDESRTRAEDQQRSPRPMMQAANALHGWLALLLAGLLEIAWALGLKYSDGLTRLWPSVTMIAAIALSFGLLAVSLKSVPFGTAYAVWTGIGAVGTVIIGMAAFGEPADIFRVTCLAFIIAGMVGLNLASHP